MNDQILETIHDIVINTSLNNIVLCYRESQQIKKIHNVILCDAVKSGRRKTNKTLPCR